MGLQAERQPPRHGTTHDDLATPEGADKPVSLSTANDGSSALASHWPPRLLPVPGPARPVAAPGACTFQSAGTHWRAVGYDQPGRGLASAERRGRIVGMIPAPDPHSGSAQVIRPPQRLAEMPPLPPALGDDAPATEPAAIVPPPASSLPPPPPSDPEPAPAFPEPAFRFRPLPLPAPQSELPQPPAFLQPGLIEPEVAQAPTASDAAADQPLPLPATTPQQTPFAPAAIAPSLPPSTLSARTPAVEAATRQALAAIERACTLCQKGLVATAAAELRRTLNQIAQVLDTQEGTSAHSEALAAALAALDDADHPHAAAAACQQMQAAVGQVPAASQVLQKLGQVQMLQAAAAAALSERCVPRAILLEQMALAVDPANWQAANELGVLLAGSGRWVEAREALLKSVQVHPHAAGWHNLAVVHAQLGEEDLARRAASERQLLAEQDRPKHRATPGGPSVRWVDPATFAASGDPPLAALSAAPGPSRGTTRR